ncbi:hypothetical protein DSH65_03435 [Enterococcus faecalis]|uniref:Uncharacterized protein n=2 Tax=Enterococcus TaxID=1350 RepID=A0A8B3RTN6_ENTFL|nr:MULTISPECIES: hypothetical protein [Enterococcus]EGO2696614.1 hypothetical protein [Enterococcus faecalis]EGO2741934.1 hypothetical protein [Enterococcus faecalis]EGO2801717.1 hypothetical protein [Enterococcus faecalis]EGO2810981.1 hypothetical protein [Enterococcus faecalis]EGO2830275.1 hypothetical protein [Enterococcus faecalis]
MAETSAAISPETHEKPNAIKRVWNARPKDFEVRISNRIVIDTLVDREYQAIQEELNALDEKEK